MCPCSQEFAIINAQAKYEAEDLTRQQRDRGNQRDKLMQAHDTGAVPLNQLKTEQERITGQLDSITGGLDAASADYAAAQAELGDCATATSPILKHPPTFRRTGV